MLQINTTDAYLRSTFLVEIHKFSMNFVPVKVSKVAKIRNRYNQVFKDTIRGIPQKDYEKVFKDTIKYHT